MSEDAVRSKDVPVLAPSSGLFWCLETVVNWSRGIHVALEKINEAKEVSEEK